LALFFIPDQDKSDTQTASFRCRRLDLDLVLEPDYFPILRPLLLITLPHSGEFVSTHFHLDARIFWVLRARIRFGLGNQKW